MNRINLSPVLCRLFDPCCSTLFVGMLPFISWSSAPFLLTYKDHVCSDKPGYVDEADRFMAHPVSFLYSMFNGRNTEELPSHIVLFDSMEKRISMFLQTENYVLVRLTLLLGTYLPLNVLALKSCWSQLCIPCATKCIYLGTLPVICANSLSYRHFEVHLQVLNK